MIPGQTVSVIAVQPHGDDAIELTYKTAEGDLGQRVLGRDAEENLAIAHAEARPLDAIAADFKLVADSTKFERSAPVRIAHLRDVDVFVTDRLEAEPLRELCRSEGVELVETAAKASS